MKFQQGLHRIQTQLDALDRMIRIIRSELENQSYATFGSEIGASGLIKSGLGAAFQRGDSVSPVNAQPYDPLMPDVWIGLDQEIGSASMTFTAKSIAAPRVGSPYDRTTRITLNPVFPLQEKPRWVTLETKLDLADAAAAKSIRIDLLTSLEIARVNREEMPKTIGVTLRLTQEGGGTKDLIRHWVPISTVPLEHSVVIAESAMKSSEIATAKNIFCILELPLSGDYAFHLDWFSVNSVAG